MQHYGFPYPWTTPRYSLLSSWRAWNTTLDVVFYDVGSLSSQERSTLSAHVNSEGSVLIVYPREAHERIRILMPWRFVQEQDKQTGDAVDTIAVAGVGAGLTWASYLLRFGDDA